MSSDKPDYLENDVPIPGQNWVCLSFVSPEKCLKNKELFSFLSFAKSLHKTENAKELFEHTFEECVEKYTDYIETHGTQINKDFDTANNFQTSVRGLKVRGVYDGKDEANYRAKQLQRMDPNHDVFVGQTGCWLPWDPNPFDIKNNEYANDKLNELMKNYNDNKMQRDMFYAQEKQEKLKQAYEEKMANSLKKDDPWMSAHK